MGKVFKWTNHKMKNELKILFTSHWKYLAIQSACKLKLFDKIGNSNCNIVEFSKLNSWNFIATEAILNVCEQEGLVILNNGKVSLTQKGQYLVSTHPDKMYYACLHWGTEHLDAWRELDYSIITGKSSFEKIYEEPFFEYIGKRPKKLDDYHNAMYAYAIDDYNRIAESLNIPERESAIDIGGGYGSLISQLKVARPDLTCSLFDLPEVVQNVHLEKITKHSGSFFENIPPGFKHYILSRVLHDWDDKKAIQILENINKALMQGDNLYIIENFADKIKNNASLLTLNMMAICESNERTEQEYRNLLSSFNFEINIIQINGYQFIIKATKL